MQTRSAVVAAPTSTPLVRVNISRSPAPTGTPTAPAWLRSMIVPPIRSSQRCSRVAASWFTATTFVVINHLPAERLSVTSVWFAPVNGIAVAPRMLKPSLGPPLLQYRPCRPWRQQYRPVQPDRSNRATARAADGASEVDRPQRPVLHVETGDRVVSDLGASDERRRRRDSVPVSAPGTDAPRVRAASSTISPLPRS